MVTITKKEFQQLADYIKINYGIYLKEEKETLVMGRLHTVLLNKKFNNFSEYYNYILTDKTGDGIHTLIERITTNHTYFMREVSHFNYFRAEVLPYLTETVKNNDLRIWSAGCSTGEEPYTLAMILDESFGQKKKQWDKKILATDISSRVLEIAKKGVYHKERLVGLPTYWKYKYFKKYDTENYILVDRIKDEVIYRKFNLVEKKYPFKNKFHVVYCKNVMIYFDHDTKRELVDKLYDLIEDGGYLFVGLSESLNRNETKFKYIGPGIYRKLN